MAWISVGRWIKLSSRDLSIPRATGPVSFILTVSQANTKLGTDPLNGINSCTSLLDTPPQHPHHSVSHWEDIFAAKNCFQKPKARSCELMSLTETGLDADVY